mmetsp:Transcript_28444/g.53755  ORF Transcript_28444/g.53755 Transcript_28444/m.53755 type:complete len:443 (+) Transcript_28444:463-1791(+)
MNFLHITIIVRIRVIPCSRRGLLTRRLELCLLLLLRRRKLANTLLFALIIAIALLITVTVILNVGIHHLFEQRRLIVQLCVIRMNLILGKSRCILRRKLHALGVIKANVGIAQHMQVEFVLALPRSQELDIVFHDSVGAGDLVDADDFSLLRSEGDPPCLQSGKGELRGVDQAGLFAFFEIVAGEFDGDGAQISLVNVGILVVVDENFAFHGHGGKDPAALQHVLLLLGGEIAKSLPRIGVYSDVLLNRLLRGLSLCAVSRFHLGKMRKLQQLAVLDPLRLRNVLTELDAIQRRLQRFLVLAHGNHGVDETARISQHGFQIFLRSVRQNLRLPREMGVQEDIALEHDGVIERRLLHVGFDLGENLADFLLVPLGLGHVAFAELGAAGEDLGEVLDEGVIVEIVVEPGVGVVHDVLLSVLGRVGVVGPDGEWDDDDHEYEVGQ